MELKLYVMKLYNIVCLFILMSFMTSCLTSGLDDLPEYDEAMISNFKFEYRWFDDVQNKMCVEQMLVDTKVDNNNFTVTCDINVPTTDNEFPEEIRENVSLSNLVGYCEISTAAIIAPLENAPKLGQIQNFDQNEPMRYKVTSASGNSNVWTLIINSFNKD